MARISLTIRLGGKPIVEIASIAQVALAAPIGFLIGLVVGLLLSSTFQVVRKREIQELRAEHDRDYSHDRHAHP